MYQIGELLIYGSAGVCRVEDITRPDWDGADKSKLYYRLKPLYQSGCIYTPVENGKVPMRPIISPEEAESLIDLIPSIEPTVYPALSMQALSQSYQSTVLSHNCRELVGMIQALYGKRKQAEAQKRRLGMVDERFMKQAEQLLHGELAAVLNIEYDEVPAYIQSRLQGVRSPVS